MNRHPRLGKCGNHLESFLAERDLNSYGELIPRSVLGRLFTVPLLVFGLLLIALPSFVLGRNFAIVFDAMSNQIKQPVSGLQGV